MIAGWLAVGLTLAAALLPAAATAQDAYPLRPVRVIVGLAPGGATDIQARLFAQKLLSHPSLPVKNGKEFIR